MLKIISSRNIRVNTANKIMVKEFDGKINFDDVGKVKLEFEPTSDWIEDFTSKFSTGYLEMELNDGATVVLHVSSEGISHTLNSIPLPSESSWTRYRYGELI